MTKVFGIVKAVRHCVGLFGRLDRGPIASHHRSVAIGPHALLDKGGRLRISSATVAVSLSLARELLGVDLLSLDDVAPALHLGVEGLPADVRLAAASLPFAESDLKAARANHEMLVFRLGTEGERPLTILRLLELFPQSFDPQPLTKVGYALRDEWGISLEPLAKADTCRPGWHLVRKDPLPESCNLSYYEQDAVLEEFGKEHRGARRRTAVEAAFDTVLYEVCRRQRLLATAYDWTSSRTVDGGYLYVGGTQPNGLTLVGFSAAVRHAALGLCPTWGGE